MTIQKEKKDKPEVSVAVLTYNSSKTVLQTLESIKAQSYDKISLIVSDDCSADDTVNICNGWIKRNAGRFISANVITTDTNTGVTGNCNRALDACESDFFKLIAADDCLLPDCIGDNVAFMEDNPTSTVVFSKVACFGKRRYIKRFQSQFDYSFFSLSAQEQHSRLVDVSNCIPAATSFFRIKSLRELNIRFDERIPMMEDWPMWIMLTGKGVKLDFIDKYTVRYRVGSGGLSSSGGAVSVNYYKSVQFFELYYRFESAYENDRTAAIQSLADRQAFYYQDMVRKMKKTPEYRVGRFLLAPWRLIQNLFSK